MENLKDFLDKFASFKEERMQERKRLGKNDYNPLLKVLPAHDEVNLHSGILKSLLDPSENHEQGRLFLDLFLDEIGLKDWFEEIGDVKVLKEYKNIDIYIHNGTKHIILENKIWAGDQDEQIAKYIDILNKEEKVLYENIAVIYLTPYGDRDPSKNSLNGWNIEKYIEILEKDDHEVLYRQISYEEEILTWLKNSQEKVKNFCNLNQTIEFYKDVINNVIGNGSDIINFLHEKESEVDFKQLFQDLVSNKSNLSPEISRYERDYIINKFLEETCKDFNYFSIDNGSSYIQFILKPKNVSNNDAYFAFAWFDATNSKNWKNFGIRLIGDISKEIREKIQEEIQKNIQIPKFNGYTLSNYIVFDEKTTAEKIQNFILDNEKIIKDANEILNQVRTMSTLDILLEKWNDFHKNLCREFIHHEVFNNHNVIEALKESENYHCEIKAIDEEIVLNPQAKIHILSFKLSDDRKLKIINRFLKNNKYTECYYDVFYTNEANVYEVLKIEF